MTQNYEKNGWMVEYVRSDCLWQIISPLGVIVTRCYDKTQIMDILSGIVKEESTNGKTEEIDKEEGFIF